MANTYTQIHLHLIFAVKFRSALIEKTWKNELHKYITGIVTNQNHKLLIIDGAADHLHLLVGFRPHQSLADLMQDIKGSSSHWINKNKLTPSNFAWQSGYGGFSCSKSDLPNLISYIENQEEHHRKIRFIDEYKSVLIENDIDFDERYILKDPE